MTITGFRADADIVGRRIQISWEFDLEGTGSLADIPAVTVRRKRRDFQFPAPSAPDPFLVYDSAAFPPTGTIATDLPGWEKRDGDSWTVVTVESAARMFNGRLVEVIRRTTATTFDSLGRPTRRHVTILDTGDSLGGLDPGTTYYYQIFSPSLPADADPWLYRATATPGEGYGLSRTLYESLPAIYRRHDVVTRIPTPGAEGVPEAAPRSGQLRRFLDLFGTSLDLMRSTAEGLRGLHDVDNVDYRFLPLMAHWIGWDLSFNASIPVQRHEIKYAPALYQLVGTIPGCIIWVERLTGWDCKVKEFIHNVFRTNAPETIHLWEIWDKRHDGTAWSDAQQLTRTEGFDGRPAAVLDSAGHVWSFWHADRSHRREIWLQRLDGVDPAPRRAMLDTPDDAPDLDYTDENPAAVVDGARIWLFWDSDRDGSWDIWTRPYDGLPGGAPVRLTEHPEEDRYPAAVRDGAGDIWVFWQSDRRGRTDIWARVFDGTDWSEPERITNAQYRDEMPAAVMDGTGRIWLFWSADLGDRNNIMVQIHEAGTWSSSQPVTEGQHRDMAPTAVWWNSKLWLFWHSNRENGWQIWGRVHDGTDWSDPFVVTSHVAEDKEPVVVVDGAGELRLMYRSQRGGERYKSRTIDVNDAEMLDRLQTYEDRAHYTFDTGLQNEDWYAPNTVGLYLTPNTEDSELIAQQIDRVRHFMEPFRPLPVRFVWILDLTIYEEWIDTSSLIREEFFDEIS